MLSLSILFCMQSLGYPRMSLTLVDTDHGHRPQVKYLDGSFCPQDHHTKMSSQIEFYCDPAAGKVFRFFFSDMFLFNICSLLFFLSNVFSFCFLSLNTLCGTQGTPILQSILDDCHYEFEWPTNIMCPMHVAEFRKNTCDIYNNQTNRATDLKTIFQNGLVKVCIKGIVCNWHVCQLQQLFVMVTHLNTTCEPNGAILRCCF